MASFSLVKTFSEQLGLFTLVPTNRSSYRYFCWKMSSAFSCLLSLKYTHVFSGSNQYSLSLALFPLLIQRHLCFISSIFKLCMFICLAVWYFLNKKTSMFYTFKMALSRWKYGFGITDSSQESVISATCKCNSC